MLFQFVIFVAVIVALFALYTRGIRHIPLVVIARQLKLKRQVENQTGFLCFDKLSLQNDVLGIEVGNTSVTISPYGLLIDKHGKYGISVVVDSVDVEIRENCAEFYAPKPGEVVKVPEQLSKPTDRLKTRIVSLLLSYFFKKICIEVKRISVKYENKAEVSTALKVKYRQRGIEGKLSLAVGDSRVRHMEKVFAMNAVSMTLRVDMDAMFSLSLGCDSIMLLDFCSKHLVVSTENDTGMVKVQPFVTDITVNSGKLWLSMTEICLTVGIVLPNAVVAIDALEMKVAMPRIKLDRAFETKNLYVAVQEINVKLVTERWLTMTKCHFIIDDFNKPEEFEFGVDSITHSYSSLDGMNLFRIVKQLQNDSTEESRPVLDFPKGHGKIRRVCATLRLTDEAIIGAEVENVSLSDMRIQVPSVSISLNGSKLGVGHGIMVSSPDKTYLTIGVNSFKLVDDGTVAINKAIVNILCGWNLIKSLVSRGIFDSETLPLPIRIHINDVCIEILDTEVGRKLQGIHKVMPSVLRQKVILRHILDAKVKSLELKRDAADMANTEVDKFVFAQYRQKVEALSYHRVLFCVQIHDVSLTLDSRDFVHKPEILGQLSPATAELYPDPVWETMEGFIIDAKLGRATVEVMDLKHPFVEVENVAVSGKIVIAEMTNGEHVDFPVTVHGEPFTVAQSLTGVKLYSDLQLKVGTAKSLIGGAFMKIVSIFSNKISGFVPEAPDPSPELRWWDMLRSMFHGLYKIEVDHMYLGVIGGSRFDQQDDVVVIDGNGVKCSITSGNWEISLNGLDVRRKEGGPLLMRLPVVEAVLQLAWECPSGDARKHICMPDAARLYEPGYDTFEAFRATGLSVAVRVKILDDDLTPSMESDLAHLQWLLEPLLTMGAGPLLNSPYHRYYGGPAPPQLPPLANLSDLKMKWSIEMTDCSMLATRVFDHFPVKDAKFFCSSVDVVIIKPRMSMSMETAKGETQMVVSFDADAVNCNATDLPAHAGITIDSTTFCVVSKPSITYDTQIRATASDIKVYGSQVFIGYVIEFTKAMASVFPESGIVIPNETSGPRTGAPLATVTEEKVEAPTPGGSLVSQLLKRTEGERVASEVKGCRLASARTAKDLPLDLSTYTEEFITVQVPTIQVVFESIEYDASVYACVNVVNLSLKKCPEDGTMGGQAMIGNVTVVSNAGFNPPPESLATPLVLLEIVTLTYADRCISQRIHAEVDGVNVNLHAGEVGLMVQVYKEISKVISLVNPPKDKSEEDVSGKPGTNCVPIMLDATITSVRAAIYGSTDVIGIARGQSISARIRRPADDSLEIAVTLCEFEVTDIRKVGTPQAVGSRWTEKSSAGDPLIRVQANFGSDVGGITIVNQVEVNVEPIVVFYDAGFFDYLMTLAVDDELKAGEYIGASHILPMIQHGFSQVDLPPGLLPEIDRSFSAYYNMSEKTMEFRARVDRAAASFLLRYFRITSTRMCVSYFNPDNHVFTSINDFVGSLHDVILQDVNATMKTLVDSLIRTISIDMIPQFFRHLLGVGKIQSTKNEADLAKWLSSGTGGSPDRKKELLFGKSKKA